MNAKAATCPPSNILSDFGLGKLDDRLAETLNEHLETCADCRRVVDRMAGDSFVERMRAAVGPPKPLAGPEATMIFGAESVSNVASSSEIPTTDGTGPARGQRELAAPSSAIDPSGLTLPPALAASPDFEIIKALGQGGMGVVYLARNRMMDRLEVLKVVNKSHLDRPGALERFQQEIRSAARLLHPNIVAAHSVPRLGDLLVFAMEYVDGQDLSQVVKRRGPLPITNATYYAQQVALGLQHAHEKGMVHRDIKPSNLMLAVEGKKHIVKILDFGLAKATSEKLGDHGLTKTGQMLGTPDYIAPEQTLNAQKADIRADIYSLGCTLYYLLSGHPPFQGQSLFEILQAHHQTAARPLNLVRSDVPVELATIVSRMMAKNPEDRFQTPAEVARVLGPFFKAPAPAGVTAELPPPASSAILPSPLAGEGPGVRGLAVGAAPIPVAADPIVGIEAAPGRPRKKTKPSRRKFLVPVAIGLLLAGFLGAAALIYKFKTADGIVVVKVNVANPDVLVDGNRMTVTWADGGKQAEIHLPPGSRKIALKKDGFKAFGKTVSISDGGQELVTATLEPLSKLGTITPSPGREPVGSSIASGSSSGATGSASAPPSVVASKTESAYQWSPGTPAPAIAPFDSKQARAHQEAWAKHLGVPVEQTNSIGMKLVLIPPGEFMMGSTQEQNAAGREMSEPAKLRPNGGESQRLGEEVPQHRVTLTKPHVLGATEVTIGQFRKFVDATRYVTETEKFGFGNSGMTKLDDTVMPEQKRAAWRTPGYPFIDDSPVTQVTWNDAVVFCNWLSDNEKLSPCYRPETRSSWISLTSGTGYRLPTEAEWEFACRAGTATQFSFGDDLAMLDIYAWFGRNSRVRAQAVGLKHANPFGLFDMHGNAYEWCQDYHAGDFYSTSPQVDPVGPAFGSKRVSRGGDWRASPDMCRSAFRFCFSAPTFRSNYHGFRVLRVATHIPTGPASVASPEPAGSVGSKPDSIGANLAKAKETYENKVRSLRDVVIKALDRKEATTRANGDKKTVDQIKDERETFETSGKIPTLVPTGDYARQLQGARSELEAAYEAAIKAYTKAGMDEQGAATEAELAKFRQQSAP